MDWRKPHLSADVPVLALPCPTQRPVTDPARQRQRERPQILALGGAFALGQTAGPGGGLRGSTADADDPRGPVSPAASARRHRFADIRDTRNRFATSRSKTPASISSAAANRTCSRRARSAASSPPPSGYCPLRTGPGSIVARCRHRTRLGPGAGQCDREPAIADYEQFAACRFIPAGMLNSRGANWQAEPGIGCPAWRRSSAAECRRC
jgi:hypothetical protein